MISDSLGDRMKGYESVTHHHLIRRCPVIVRVDGRSFHTVTRNLSKPFNQDFVSAMSWATEIVSREIQGCKLAYVQSDEASFLLLDTDRLETQPWFGYDLGKVISISSALMTSYFGTSASDLGISDFMENPVFDARAFNLPPAEVTNYFVWRAKDWKRNSIQSLAQTHFSPKQLHGKKTDDLLAMLTEIGASWGSLEDRLKYGMFFLPEPKTRLCNIEPNFEAINSIVERSVATRP